MAPKVIKQKGFAGIDYYGDALLKNPNWIKESHDLGMKVNVWTIDQMKEIQKCVDSGVDFITTNKPEEAKKIAVFCFCIYHSFFYYSIQYVPQITYQIKRKINQRKLLAMNGLDLIYRIRL
ncbi:Membrane domain of membrane-anchored glycerophosphoryl diester phosphodiesterase [Segatella copri]|nr:Membrane domain of membrane-anchored glycerophosphoryl diester phosphodiesterase [Segatella copri]